MKDIMRDLLEEQILKDAIDGDTTVFAELLSLIDDELIYGSLGEENQAKLTSYYEIHVCGDGSYSTSIKTKYPLFSTDDIINLAVEKGILDYIDAAYVDYVEELTFDEWNTHFNNK